MPNLFVDFIHRRRSSVNASDGTKKAVTFLPTVEIRSYKLSDESDSSKLYCTKDDFKKFERARERAVKKLHRRHLSLLSSSSSESQETSKELGCILLTTGLENILTPNIIEKSFEQTSAVRQAVFDEQKRQKESGYDDPEMIALVSRKHSAWGAQRVIRIGSFQ